ncbi:MAG TPA: hypothetical protein PKD00_07105 [Burkholderiales bacterium]|nr:hypothetical protein [Burkholderiales bacterium]
MLITEEENEILDKRYKEFIVLSEMLAALREAENVLGVVNTKTIELRKAVNEQSIKLIQIDIPDELMNKLLEQL